MKYMGSKNRYADELLKIILPHRNGRAWVEPFVGGCNMIDKVDGERYANDNNEYLINMWRAVQDGWIPPNNISEEEYQKIKNNPDPENPLYAFVAIGCSYSGKWWGGYARGKDKDGKERNYCRESRDNILKQAPKLKGVEFSAKNYTGFDNDFPDNSLIYCDPPYADTTKYKSGFNHTEFWDWCEEMEGKGHYMFVSEYSAPKNWYSIWEKEVNNSLTKETGAKKGIEKLWVMAK
jgi:DNA adenine methylase